MEKIKLEDLGYKLEAKEDGVYYGGYLDLRNTNISELPDNLEVGGCLSLYNTKISNIPKGLEVRGNLDLDRTNISELPNNLKVGRDLYLYYTTISELPNDLEVGGNLYLKGTNISNYPVVYNCGKLNRAIYLDLKNPKFIRIGCFKGTKSKAIKAIKKKYSNPQDYIIKVEECFNKIDLWHEWKKPVIRSEYSEIQLNQNK